MLPAILAIIQMAKQKADAQNAERQQMAQNIQNQSPVQTNSQPAQMPTINSVFGNQMSEEEKRRQMMGY